MTNTSPVSSYAAACDDVVEAAAALADGLARTTPATIRWYFLEDALVALAEAEDLLLDKRRKEAVDALLSALGLISDAIDATEPGGLGPDPATTALEAATRATAQAAQL
jgi:hypothetical protein